MDLQMVQNSRDAGSGWFEWSVWLAGPDADLDRLKAVRYRLHESFPNPVRTVTDRGTNFRLDASGWGEFMIYADALTVEGAEVPLRHWLKLSKSNLQFFAQEERPERETLFLSASAADEPLADALQDELERNGYIIVRPGDEVRISLEAALERYLEEASAAVILVSDKYSPWLRAELHALEQRKLPVIPVVIGESPRLPDSIRNFEQIRIKGGEPVEIAAQHVAREILDRYQNL
ncbi:MAG TPA: pYEATS domain-containing protein [Rariglobus sp.]